MRSDVLTKVELFSAFDSGPTRCGDDFDSRRLSMFEKDNDRHAADDDAAAHWAFER